MGVEILTVLLAFGMGAGLVFALYPRRKEPVSREELEQAKMYVDDVLDKTEHLYARMRKRRLVEDAEAGKADGKDAVRERALRLLFPGRMPVDERTP